MRSNTYFEKYSIKLLFAFLFFAPLSIAISQTVSVCLLVLWVFSLLERKSVNIFSKQENLVIFKAYIIPLVLFFLSSLIAAFFGLNTMRSFGDIPKTALYLMLPICLWDVISFQTVSKDSGEFLTEKFQLFLKKTLGILVLGQSLAALHTVFSSILPFSLPTGVPGAVTESGQLALVFPCAVCLLFSEKNIPEFFKKSFYRELYIFFGIAFILLAAWPLEISRPVSFIFTILSCLFIFSPSYFHKKDKQIFNYLFLIVLVLLLLAAFILNLKRGPWLGIFVGFVLLSVLSSKKFILPLILSSVAALIISPVRDRLFSLSDHFAIHGGRKNMWALGIEMIERYPLGIGSKNVSYMRTLDPTLPTEHRHMHNNFLTIAVESGIFGAATYLWWVVTFLFMGFSSWKKLKNLNAEIANNALFLTIALLSSQVAGIVEYNFGDSEVRMVAFILIGLVLSINSFMVNYYKR